MIVIYYLIWLKIAIDKFKRFDLLKKELKEYIYDWTKVDSNIGRENISKGKSFEEKCKIDGVNLLLGYLNLQRINIKVLTNQKWAECPGEIDIAIVDKEEKVVHCLAECKSKPFDIAQGHK